MSLRPLLTIVLAAGQGTRMNSALPKVLHRVGGLSLLGHVLSAVPRPGEGRVAVVVGPGMESVRAEAEKRCPGVEIFIQQEQLGTAHAALAAEPALASHQGDVLVVFGDTPLLTSQSLGRLTERLTPREPVAVLGFEARDAAGYGRILRAADGQVLAVREDKDASEEERRTTLCCSGVLAFRGETVLSVLRQIGRQNAQGQYYLTDAVSICRSTGGGVALVVGSEEEVLGINTRAQLAAAEAAFQSRARARIMAQGATLIAPETVWLSFDTVIGRDVVIEPNVFFGPGVTVEDEVQIMANCHFEGALLQRGARVGPFARMRPGANIGPDARVGNFVEVKNATIGQGAKANHLAYLGDASVGAKANIGAGTIFCNYDGYAKHTTTIGAGAFVGSNSSLVAPIRIGDNAYIGSGSVITKDVPAGALALERSPLEVKPGWAEKFRTMMMRRRGKAGDSH
jgi:bifunctional UDP-N-acetylglucosamine pyrophosphorylase/glucosamine-1-phosphate N-acetyltransferase